MFKEPVVIHYNDSFFDRGYIKNNSQRLFFYNKISKALSLEEIKSIKEELIDRFGPLRQATKNLFLSSQTRIVFSNTIVSKVEIREDSLLFTLEGFNTKKNPLCLINELSNFERGNSCKIQFKESKSNSFMFSVSRFINQFKTISNLGCLFSNKEFM